MSVFWRILAIEIWFFCICANGHCLPDTTVWYIICNGIKIPHWSACGLAVEGVIDDLAGQTANNGYNYYTQSTNSGQVCCGHAACAGHLSSFDCHLCLVNAGYDLANWCSDNTGAQEQLKDCRMRYESYEFKVRRPFPFHDLLHGRVFRPCSRCLRRRSSFQSLLSAEASVVDSIATCCLTQLH